MSNRNSSENSDSISLFPFLAVLLCTMGALLVLLVIFMQRAAVISLLPDATDHQLASANGPVLPTPKIEKTFSPVIDNDKTAELEKELADIAEYQKKLEEIKAEGEQRLKNEQLRLSHLEDHRRRLEEEMAKLAIAAEQLKQTEANQTVDQEQAEEELERLTELIAEKQTELAELKNAQTGGKKSYAIVPYRGPNGTFRMPVYLECKGDMLVIHPEGHQLSKNDFVAASWPGNPLAAVLRATREFHNNKSKNAGQPEPPDPYPLILVRPSGLKAYLWARSAIAAWDSDYGYEFIDEDMKLAFPIAADPQLAQVQNHALMIARERLLHMVQAAPSRFPNLRMTSGSVYGANEGAGTAGSGYGAGSGSGQGVAAGGGETAFNSIQYGNGDGNSGTAGGYGADAAAGEPMNGAAPDGQQGSRLGEYRGEQNSQSVSTSGASTDGTSQGVTAAGGNAESEKAHGMANSGGPDLGPRYAQQGNGNSSASNAPSEPINGSKLAGNGQSSGSASGGGSSGSSGGGAGGSPGSGFSSLDQSIDSIANTRGSNWAVNQPKQKSVAIRRTIHVVVRDNQMILQSSNEPRRGTIGKPISLDQPVEVISDEFAAAVKERIDDWGLAGSGMYWRPVLELNVEPGAQMTASRITHLLHDSGVEVQFPATATNTNPPVGGTVR